MFYEFLYDLHVYFSPFNVFRYITFRTSLAAFTALFSAIIIAPYLISWLKRISMTQQIRDDGPKNHFTKAGTPTMGGIIILIAITFSMLLWGNFKNVYVCLIMFSLIAFGLVGFIDDYLKVIKRNSKGLKAKYKFAAQSLIAIFICSFLYFVPVDPYSTVLSVPFFKKWLFDLGIFYIFFGVFVIVGASNAVNLTDGIDGLAIGLVAIATLTYAVFIYVSGHAVFARYLQVLYLPGVGELTVFCGAMLGASLGFLWYNAHPAEIFMGDVGALSLGGALGTLAVMTKHEIVLAVVGGIFVIETVSVVVQVLYYKCTKRRIFLMAPLHHHFELKGWREPKIIVRFWIIGIVLALISLSTLKLR
ncbi:MAG: phospho-N-acetylmuramoyl-pentapeptide-transferase [Thermodesulfovibrionales bacterium]|nr:phospho-N-acetylmuramoyl-pentapeptide-transferase [Thermodesulfovibrionales bacterium]